MTQNCIKWVPVTPIQMLFKTGSLYRQGHMLEGGGRVIWSVKTVGLFRP